jgi:DNA-binding LacI/PurR family transcriptional regulator
MKYPVRLVDIARIAGVSRAVVAHVVLGTGGKNTRCNAETATRVLKIANKLGYRPNRTAQQLRGAKSNILGVLALSTTSEVLSARLNYLEQEAAANGYRIIIGRVSNDSPQILNYIEDFLSRGIDGLIFLARMPADNEQIKERLGNISIPVIYYADVCTNAVTFNIDRVFGIKLAVEHLVNEGYKRIALQITTKTIDTMKARIEGYLAAFAGNNLQIQDELIYSSEDFDNIGLEDRRWKNRARDVVEHLVDDCGADALIVSDDRWAAFVIRHLLTTGRNVPVDIGVVGFDNSVVSKISFPTITSVDQCNHITAKNIINYINEFDSVDRSAEILMTKPELVVRDSSSRSKRFLTAE